MLDRRSKDYTILTQRAGGRLVAGILACASSAGCTETPSGSAEEVCGDDQVRDAEGGCVTPGVPPEMCAPGFSASGFGCEPMMPAASCGEGKMAIPGDTECREVAPCPDSVFPDVQDMGAGPVVHVSQETACGPQDEDCGSTEKPWKTVKDALAHAVDGATVAVSAGSYEGDILISQKDLHLIGLCPAMVEIVGGGVEDAAITVKPSAARSHIRGVSIRGPKGGITVDKAPDALLEEIWIHATDPEAAGYPGIQSSGATTSTVLRKSLLEDGAFAGFFITDGVATVEDSVIRSTRETPKLIEQTAFGFGVTSSVVTKQATTSLTVQRSVIESNHRAGVSLEGGVLTVAGSVLRDNKPDSNSGLDGSGVAVSAGFYGQPSRGTVKGSLLEGNAGSGALAAGADLELDGVVVRGTVPTPAYKYGIAVVAGDFKEALTGTKIHSNLTIRSSLLESNVGVAVGAFSSPSVLIEGTRVVDTQMDSDGELGLGISLWGGSQGSIRSCLLDGNHEYGILALDASAKIADTRVANTVSTLLFDDSGDGIALVAETVDSSLELTDCDVVNSSRAGIFNFGGHVSYGGSTIRCAQVPLAQARMGDRAPTWETTGKNLCGCPQATEECKVQDSDGETHLSKLD